MYKNKSGALTSLREEGSHSVRSPSVQAFGNGWDFCTRERQMTMCPIIFDQSFDSSTFGRCSRHNYNQVLVTLCYL
jgi:hypothetical protein